ncbi:nucleoside triphosphate pyrophosphatase [Zhongshania sp.]|uniref:Maf family protein n=1 Tax=Zhongshania sp. TaxID=1971902 RepID=UPI0035635326
MPKFTPTALPLILASSSSYRRTLLTTIGLHPTCQAPNIDESALPSEDAATLAKRLSVAKALAVAKHFPAALIIASDQSAELDGQILGKPGTIEKAKQQLAYCSGRDVVFHTGLCLLNSQTGHQHIAIERVTAGFRKLSTQEIERYTNREPALDCAGSFKVEGLGISLFRHVRSDDPNTLIGLPLIRLIEFLSKENYPVL